MKLFEKIQLLQVHIEVIHTKKIPFPKTVKEVDDVLKNENLSINYDWLQICGKLPMNRNFCLNIKNITTDYTRMHIYTDFIKATKIEESLMDIIQNHDTEDIYELDQPLNFTIGISLSLNMQFFPRKTNNKILLDMISKTII